MRPNTNEFSGLILEDYLQQGFRRNQVDERDR